MALLERALLVAIVGVAAFLRLHALARMPPNAFYDAAARSMGSSWHAFLVGAFNPNASIAIDKPPIDLWLQVASTKLFGFTTFALHLPAALGSVAAVVLMYDLVRRLFGRAAGLASALAYAILPVEVMTARSDTMDAWMTALLVLAAWLMVRGVERRRGLEIYLAGIVVGLAFETKLFAALLPVPALVLLFLLASDASVAMRLRQLAIAGVAMLGTALAWPLLFSAVAEHRSPYPLGSNDGTIWSTIFGFNGLDRLTGSSTRSALDRLSPAGPMRLFAEGPLHLDVIVGTSLLVALTATLGALAATLLRRRNVGRRPAALIVSMATWLVLDAALLSFMSHAPVRYMEVLAPPMAALFGIGATLIIQPVVRRYSRDGTRRLAALVLAAGVLAAALAAPAAEAWRLTTTLSSDSGALGNMPPRPLAALSRYLTRHQGRTQYEFAVVEAHLASALIAKAGRPVLVLAGTPYHPLLGPRELARAAHAGKVKYVLVAVRAKPQPPPIARAPHTSRGQMIAWVERHGVDVTRQAGLDGYGIVYRLR